MSDYISREAAKMAVVEATNKCYSPYNAIVMLPAADVVERKTGKWIYDCERTMHDGWTYRQYHCSLCEFQMIGGIHNFCPNCGARMVSE